MFSDLLPSDCFIFLVWSHYYILQDHVEGYHELTAKTKAFFSLAVAKWDAEFYVKIDDDVHVNLGTSPFFSCHMYIIVPDNWKLMIFTYLEINSWTHHGIVGTLAATLARHRLKPRVYIGCMKSGPVLYQK